MALSAGDIVNHRYRILKQLSQGGFGAIYRAEDLSLKTICALKENLDYWEEAQRQFEQEALLLAGLRHPNLPRVIDYFTIPAQGQYLVMDFVEGHDLQEIIERVGKPLIQKQVLGWIDQICDALIYLHGRRPPIIHRDVKPANIRLTNAGKAMLVDFGVAKRFHPDVKTTEGARAVTPGYSPIEQYGQGKTDTRADIYAVGATLYTLLTAHRPPESIDLITGKPLPSPRQYNPEISPALERVVLRSMELMADSRFETAAMLRQALLDAQSLGAESEHVPPPSPVVRKPLAHVARPSETSRPSSHLSSVQMEWMQVPEGEFIFGEDGGKLSLPAFEIGRYPVTNQQYRSFLLADRRRPAPAMWRGREFPPGTELWPVVNVSYADALAFCAWLGCRLPTAPEWEKAARGVDGRIYPWGDDWQDARYCNHWEARNEGPTPVDRYPEGASPFGVLDMAGNVWEWTATDAGAALMHEVRGGSWRGFGSFAVRITQGDRLMLDERRDDVGFRCARSS